VSALGQWLAYGVPWWLWAGLAGAAVLALARVLGVRVALAAAALAAVLLAYRRGAQAGWTDRQAKGERDAQAAVDQADAARRAAEHDADDPGRLRHSDGWRRD